MCRLLYSLPEGGRGMHTQFSICLLSGIALSFEGACSEDLLKAEHTASMLNLDMCLCSVPPVISALIC